MYQSRSKPSNPFSWRKLTTLAANARRLGPLAEICPSNGCVAVPLSEKVHPPTLTKIFKLGLYDFSAVVSPNKLTEVLPSVMGTILKVVGSTKAKAKFI